MACVIGASTLESIRSLAAAAYPAEACGMLVGRDLADDRAIEYAAPTRNVDPHARRYTIAPEDFLAAEKQARGEGLDVVGFYHSHPDVAPEPSERDAAAAWPHYTYLIVAVREGRAEEMAAWRRADAGFVRETLRVVAESETTEREAWW